MTDGQDDHASREDLEQMLQQAQAADTPGGDGGSSPSAATATNAEVTGGGPPPTDSTGGMDADVQLLLNQAEAALRSVDEPTVQDLDGVAPFQLPQLHGTPANTERASLELLRDVELDMRIELGRSHMYLEDVLQLRKGSVVPLDKMAGDPVDIYVNGRLVARGEVLVLNDNFCVRIAELISGKEFD